MYIPQECACASSTEHNMPGIASSATSVVIGHLAAATKRIRVGSGGIMLPNHAPLVVAEQCAVAAMTPGAAQGHLRVGTVVCVERT